MGDKDDVCKSTGERLAFLRVRIVRALRLSAERKV